MRRLLPIILLVLVPTSTALAKDWRGILPMQSTREDVEALLGPPQPPPKGQANPLHKGPSTYYLEEGEVYIVFANEQLLKVNNCEGVPLDTVVSIQVTPKDEMLIGNLKLDEKDFRKFNSTRTPGVDFEAFIDEQEGLIIRISKGVDRIVYIASALDRGRCPGFYDAPEQFVQNAGLICSLAFAEYGNIRFSDEKAQLDNFAIQLQNEEKTQGYIIVYAGQKATVAEAQTRANRARDYLINVREINPERVKAVDGGFREDFSVRLFILPEGAEPPPLMPTLDPSQVELIYDKPRRQKRKRQ